MINKKKLNIITIIIALSEYFIRRHKKNKFVRTYYLFTFYYSTKSEILFGSWTIRTSNENETKSERPVSPEHCNVTDINFYDIRTYYNYIMIRNIKHMNYGLLFLGNSYKRSYNKLILLKTINTGEIKK